MERELHIDLLGGLGLYYRGEQVTAVNAPRLKELLSWLVLNRDKPQSRQHLAFLFWPDSTEKQALSNFRNLLHLLRNALPEADAFLIVDNKSIQWNTKAPFSLDVAEFEQAVDLAHKAEEALPRMQTLKNAIDLYGGPLLPECYEEWIVPYRDRLRQACGSALQELIDLMEEDRDYQGAIRYAKKWIRHNPLNESAWRKLMELYARNDDRAHAVKTYRECVSTLHKELDIKPAPETRQVFERLLTSFKTPTDTKLLEVDPAQDEEWALVGRRAEWESIHSCWKQTLTGTTQCLLIEGDPGIGKSKLGLEFVNTLRRQGYPVAYCRCYKAAGSLSYATVIDWLQEEFIQQQLDALDTVWLTELVRLMPELLVQYPNLSYPGPITDPLQRRQLFEAIFRALAAGDKATLLFLDDMQWCDSETLEWISYLFHTKQSHRLMLLGSLRPVEAEANKKVQQLLEDLRSLERLQVVTLAELNEQETRELASLIADFAIDEKTARRIYEETEGHPLFIVEMVRDGQWLEQPGESTKDNPPPVKSLPQKVTQFISARFEHLSESTQKLMDMVAVVGRECSIEILQEASELKGQDLIDALEELIHHHILWEQHSGIYDFTHDKLREVACSEIGEARKRFLHNRIADAIETVYADHLHGIHGRLVYHYEQAGHHNKASGYYEQATEEARQILDDLEAAGYLEQSPSLLKRLKNTTHFRQKKTDPEQVSKPVDKLSSIKATGRVKLIKKLNSKLLMISALLAALLLLFVISSYFFNVSSSNIDSLAVLPLENLSGDTEQEYFVDGITDALTAELGQINALKVISRTSAMHYKDSDKRIPQIARELDVDALVEGSVRQAGNTIGITLQLVNGKTDEQIWAKSYERHLKNILMLQGEIARTITDELQVELAPVEKHILAKKRNVDPEAYRLVLKGNFYWMEFNPEAFRQAIPYYREAIKIDPDYAEAYGGLAVALGALGEWNNEFPQRKILPEMKAAALKALAIDSTVAAAHVVVARIKHTHNWDWKGAEKPYRRAYELRPTSGIISKSLANYLYTTGRYSEAAEVVRHTLGMDPLTQTSYVELILALIALGKYDEAIEVAEKQKLYRGMAEIHYLRGDTIKTLQYLEKVSTSSKTHHHYNRAKLSFLYGKTGEINKALQILEDLKEYDEHGEYVAPTAFVIAYTGISDYEKALQWLEQAMIEKDPKLIYLYASIYYDPLSNYPRFKTLLNKFNFPSLPLNDSKE